MNKFIKELRRREVFRTAGLYVGICWILIEASSVVLPTFDAPEWVLKALIIVAVVGFPIMLVLAWIYDVTEHGIEKQADVDEAAAPAIGSRKMDFVVIGLLSVALVISVYLNVTSGPQIVEELEPVSVLIADFDNQTGQTLFDGLLEQALNVGIESAPHITAYQRNDARSLAERLQPGSSGLDSNIARLIAVREGIKLVLAGTIEAAGSGFELTLNGVDAADGSMLFEIQQDADSIEAVLVAVGELSTDVRDELGDTTLEDGQGALAETFTAASLEAAQAYTTAIRLGYEGKHEEAVELYRKATELDEKFGRAYSSWALSEFKLGRTEQAEALWETSLSLMGTMTERERLRTLGLYYATVARNYEKAVESFSELVEKYPADAAGHNNLAVASFLTLNFQKAAEEGQTILDIYPASQLYRSNQALYAMYSGDFETATALAAEVISTDPEYGTAYLPLAISALAQGDADAARANYKRMAETSKSEHGESLAALGLADVDLFVGEIEAGRAALREAIAADLESDRKRAAAVKQIALAQSLAEQQDFEAALEAVGSALELGGGESLVVPAAMIYAKAGDAPAAQRIAGELSSQLQSQSRAYGRMLQGLNLASLGKDVESIIALREAVDLADLWLIRVQLGMAYLEAGSYAEALDEFTHALQRRGEATAVFLDDTPTYRYLAELPYWMGRAQEGLHMAEDARASYEEFLSRRPQGGPLAEDASDRLTDL
jgi:tetratricopeptide (TPR) repeat protein